MPDPTLLANQATAQRLLGMLPWFVQSDPNYQAAAYAAARELDRLEGMLEQVRAQFNPATADILLPAWQATVGTTISPAGVDLATQQQNVIALLRKTKTSDSGSQWEADMTAFLGPGWSYQEHNPSDPSSPAPGTIVVTVPFPPSSSDYLAVQAYIEATLDANLQVLLQYSGGFLLDQSPMDISTLNG